MYVSRLGMQLFRERRHHVCRNVTGKARNGRIMEGEDQEKTNDEDCGQRARRLCVDVRLGMVLSKMSQGTINMNHLEWLN